MNRLNKWFGGVLAGGLVLIVLSMGFLYSFRSAAPGSLSNALVSRQVRQALVHDVGNTGPMSTPTPKTGKIFRPKPTTTPQIVPVVSFPACFREVGWYYGWHGKAFEYGTDFDCGYRTPTSALWSGTVVGAYRTCWDTACSSTSGGVVIVRALVPGIGIHDTYYLHLDAVNVRVGEWVSKGHLLGWTGGCLGYGHWITSPWYTSGCHLEIGFDCPFLQPYSFNTNPLPYISRALG